MACTNTSVAMTPMGVGWNSPTQTAIPAGPWQSLNGLLWGRGWLELRGKTGNLSVTPGVQFTNNPPNPGSNFLAVGSAVTADNVSDPNGWTDLSSVNPVGQYKYWRPVYLVVLTSGTTLAVGSVSGVIEMSGG